MFGVDAGKPADNFKVHDKINSVADIVNHQMRSYERRPAIRVDIGGTYRTILFSDYVEHIHTMIRFFNRERAEQKVVATWCKNRLEWDMCAMASFYTANILFPLDTKFNPDELDHLLLLNPPDYMLLSYAQLTKFRALKKKHGLRTVALVADLLEVFEDMGVERTTLLEHEISLKALCSANAEPGDTPRESGRLSDPGTILGHYATSGTVSLPKIVGITHGGIVAEVNCSMDVINLRPNEDVLNIGPYTHIATLVEFLVSKTRGYSVTYFTREPDDDDVLEDEIHKLARLGVRIKVLMAVPKFWIFLVKEVLEEMKNKPVMKGLYEHLISIEKTGTLQDIGTIEKAKLTAMRIFLRNKLGGYFSYGISSSTKLDGALVLILGKLGITVIDVYGATECTGIISRNRLNDIVPGSCGKLIPELEFRLSDMRKIQGLDREVGILSVKGPTVADSYISRNEGLLPIASAGDGFYSTGDLCGVDGNRQVFLVGRQKELISWDDGSLIDPQHLSNLLTRGIFIKDAMAVRRLPEDLFLSVFIFPDVKRLEKDQEYRKEIATGVSKGAALKRRLVESIKYAASVAKITPKLDKDEIYLLPRKLDRTPTHKIKFVFEMKRLDEAVRI